MNRWDLIVVGAGAVGSAALRAASERGARVLGLEQHTPANPLGSSHGHSRIFRHAYFEHADYGPLLRHSTARFESLQLEARVPLLHRCGMLVMGSPGSAAVLGSLAAARRWELPVEAVDGRVLQARFPWFTHAVDAIAAFEADAGIVRPEAAVHAAIRVARTRAAELRVASRVFGVIEDATGVTVATDQGNERAAAVIIAAGPWTSSLLPELAPLLTVTRQVQAWMAPTAGIDTATMPCWFLDRGPDERAVYGLAPDPAAGEQAAGEQAAGAKAISRYPKVGLHGSDTVVDAEIGAASVDTSDIDRLRDAYCAIAPALAGELVDAATCLYTMSPDGHFLVGTRSGFSRTHFAAGLSGHGFKLAPALGDALADLALNGHTDLPIGFLSPSRFADSVRTCRSLSQRGHC